MMRVDTSAPTEISRSWEPKQSAELSAPVAGSPSKSTWRVVAVSVVDPHRIVVVVAGAGRRRGSVELPGAQPSTACVVRRPVGTSAKPQSYVALPSPAEPGAAPLCAPAAPTAMKLGPLLAKRTASPSGRGEARRGPAGTAMVPVHDVQDGVTVRPEAVGLNRYVIVRWLLALLPTGLR